MSGDHVGYVVVAGYLAQDIVIRTQTAAIAVDHSHGKIDFTVGGSGANVAAWLAWAGGDAELVGVTGSGVLADALVSDFKATGAIATLVRGNRTPVVASLVDRDGDRHLILDPGGPFEAIPFPRPQTDPSWLHIPGFLLYRDDLRDQTLQLAASLAPSTRISVDVSSGRLVESFGVRRFTDLLSMIGANVVLMNNLEADVIGSIEPPDRIASRVVIHRGPSSTLFCVDGEWSEASIGIKPNLCPIDSTGAGDAFAAGYILKSICGGDEFAAVEYGHVLAQFVIDHPGGQPLQANVDKIIERPI